MFGLASMLLATACLFETRDAQDPGDDTGGGCLLDTPERAFVCMTGALQRQQDGDYERSISENFLFSPTTADSLDQNFVGTDVFLNWGKQKEMDVLAILFADAQSTVVDFGTPSIVYQKNTVVRYRVSYSLDVVETAAPTDTTTYQGVAEIDVRNEGGNWRVTIWNEIETVVGFSTWGFLRGIKGLPL